ncbi:MAG: hypothetical protein JWP12_3515 [Bacteroidetes bacterium]|nr:hypothetical protein [Bacteroidota bacterium]
MKKINTLIAIVLLTITGSTINAQNFDWVVTLGGTDSDDGTDLVVDGAGNVYSIGMFEGTADFDPGPGSVTYTAVGSVGQRDIFISKLDASGNFVWAKAIPSRSANTYSFRPGIALDASGNVIVTGLFQGSVDFNPGAGTFNMSSTGVGDMFICKFDNAGNFTWAKQIGGVSWQIPSSLKTDPNGNIYVSGYFEGTTDFDPAAGTFPLSSASNSSLAGFVAKYDASGVFGWAKQFGGTGSWDDCAALALDGAGNIYVTGGFDGTEDFDPGAGTLMLTSTSSSTQGFVMKLDNSGNLLWAKATSGTGSNFARGNGIVADLSGVYYTGSFSGLVDLDPGTGTYAVTGSTSNAQIFVSKLDATGNFVWGDALTGDGGPNEGSGIAIDAGGNVYITGYFNRTVDFDPGAATYNVTTMMPGYTEAFINKFDPAGNFVWMKGFSNGNIYGKEMVVDADGNIYVTGQLNGAWAVDFDPGTGVYPVTSAGWTDSYICKLKATSTAGIDEQNKSNDVFAAYPNPASAMLMIRKNGNGKSIVKLYSVLGELVKTLDLEDDQQLVDVSALAPGMYFLYMENQTDKKVGVQKIQIMH